jgi:hypothetical protein
MTCEKDGTVSPNNTKSETTVFANAFMFIPPVSAYNEQPNALPWSFPPLESISRGYLGSRREGIGEGRMARGLQREAYCRRDAKKVQKSQMGKWLYFSLVKA